MSKNSVESSLRARVTMLIQASPDRVYSAFVEPEKLNKFWLAKASGPLRVGKTVHWHFLVAGAKIDATATTMDQSRKLAWEWSDGSRVSIDFEEVDGGTAVTLSTTISRSKGISLLRPL